MNWLDAVKQRLAEDEYASNDSGLPEEDIARLVAEVEALRDALSGAIDRGIKVAVDGLEDHLARTEKP